MTARFVILHHRLPGSEHWDLMLEKDGTLATWQLPRPLVGPADLPMSARRIGDHRLAYLDYEGPVSGDRGQVRRVLAGRYRTVHADPTRWEVELVIDAVSRPVGKALAGSATAASAEAPADGPTLAIELRAVSDDQWEVMSPCGA